MHLEDNLEGCREGIADKCGGTCLDARQVQRACGYWVSTVGRDEAVIRDYIRQQGHEDQRLDQINLWRGPASASWLKPSGRVSDPT